jgi:voltage-gated potassium channel Kch
MKARSLAGAAAGVIISGGVLFSVSQQIPPATGLYWAVETATTVGYGDVTPRGAAGHVIAVLVMLTAIPLLAAAFGQLHLDRVRAHVDSRLGEHHKAIHDRLDRIEQGTRESEGR